MNLRQLIFCGFLIAFSVDAFCTLGGRYDEKVDATSSVTTSIQKKLLKQTDSYTVHESTQRGTTIKEFVLPSGTIFAVTWRGLKHPEMNSLLGTTYSSEFQNLKKQSLQAQKASGGRAPIAVKSSRVSVKMSGHMRDVHGEVYDPTLLPADFSLQDLK